MKNHYWEWPIATYLFLGGLGGGILFLTMLFDRALSTPFLGDYAVYFTFGDVMALPMFIAIACLALGLFFLVFELGQPDVFYYVFTTKTSIIKWGAVLLSVALVLAVVWILPCLPWGWAQALAPLQDFCLIVSGVCGFAIMAYTGLLLSSLKAHSFWSTPALPVLFTISALSTACAAIFLSVGVWPDSWPFGQSGGTLTAAAEVVQTLVHVFDMVLIVFELFILLMYVLMFLGAGNTAAHAVAQRWVRGRTSRLFWFGMVLCGLVVPLLFNLTGVHQLEVIACLFALFGGVLLRFLVVYADERREIPGENRYYSRINGSEKAFVGAWPKGENLY